jgi:hypothetical protein
MAPLLSHGSKRLLSRFQKLVSHEKAVDLERSHVLQGEDKMSKEKEEKGEKTESPSKEAREEFLEKKKGRKVSRGGGRK